MNRCKPVSCVLLESELMNGPNSEGVSGPSGGVQLAAGQVPAPGFKLLRMILIDSYCRNKIVELDISSHITINGENGAGKTTLLRLLPMFFGETPSKIIRGDAVVEKFSRYYFPTTASYVIFEYQRRNQKALAVIHGELGGDGVWYRFIDSQFEMQLFKDGNAVVQAAQLHKHLLKLGAYETGPLSRRDYCQILHNTSTRLTRSHAGRFAFTASTGRLTHMERIVTGILQRATTFYDLRRMIVSSILEEDKEFALTTNRTELLAWVSEYEAHHAVMGKAVVMDDLEQLDHKRRMMDTGFAKLHARFHLLSAHQEEEVLRAERRERELKVALSSAEAAFTERLQTVSDGKIGAETKLRHENERLAKLEDRRKQFEKDGAETMATKVAGLPGLQSELEALDARHRELVSEVRSVKEVFDAMAAEAKDQATGAKSALELTKSNLYKSSGERVTLVSKENASSLAAVQARHEDERSRAESRLSQLRVVEAGLQVEARNPRPEPELLRLLEVARKNFGETGSKLETLRDATPTLHRAKDVAKLQFEAHEGQINAGLFAAESIQNALIVLLAAESAGDDTLIGFLRAHKPNWAADIGRIVPEEMLLRKDLSPELSSGADLYGVSVDLTQMQSGRFTSIDGLHEEIKQTQARLATKHQEIAEDRAACQKAHLVMSAAMDAVTAHEAAISVAKNAKAAAEERVEAAQRQVEHSRQMALARAGLALSSSSSDVKLAEEALKGLKVGHATEVAAADVTHAKLLADINEELRVATASIDGQIHALDSSLRAKLSKIAADLEESLTAKGVSPGMLKRINEDLAALRARINEANALRGYVQDYRDWLEGSWSQAGQLKRECLELEALINRHERDKKSLLGERHADLERRRAEIITATAALDKAGGMMTSIGIQMASLSHWPKDPETLEAGFDSGYSVEAFSAERVRLTNESRLCTEKIKFGVEDIRRQMCVQAGTKPERFHHAANQAMGIPPAGQEYRWIEVFRTWYNDRHLENRSSLVQIGKTTAQNISHFWRTLQDFKSNVSMFATDLRANLEQGRVFEMISDVTTEIKTHVDAQNYWEAIGVLNSEYDAWHAMGEATLPPASFVQAAKTVANVLRDGNSLVANPVDLISLKISANVNNEGLKTASNENELVNMSSNGLSYIILCVVLIGFVNRIRRKETVVIPFVIDELKDLSFSNAKTLLELLERNRIVMISAFPDVDLDLAELFSRNYKILKGREVGLIEIDVPGAEVEEEAHV